MSEEQRGVPSPLGQVDEEQGEVPVNAVSPSSSLPNNDSDAPVMIGEAPISSGPGATVATNELPVASKVVPSEPPPELMERMRSLEDQQNRIASATPVDAEEQRKMDHQASRRRSIVGGSVVVALAIFAVALGVTLGGRKSSPSPSSVFQTTSSPTPAPTTQSYFDLQNLISSASLDGGAALSDPRSPQSKALAWLEGNANLDDYPDWRKIQRHTLATFFYGANGDGWLERDGWLTDDDECTWFTSAVDPVCDDNGVFSRLILFDNNVTGTLPRDLALLSDSMRKCEDSLHCS
jgi:hypothetical protein